MSKQVELISRLLPTIPELDEIFTKIRRKYLIEEVRPENTGLVETISNQYTSEEWESIRQEIEDELRALFQSKSPALDKLAKLYKYIIDKSHKIWAFLTGKIARVPENTADKLVDGLNKNAVSGLEALDLFFAKGSEKLLNHLKTGQPIDLPVLMFNLVGKVSLPSEGEKFVFAVAHEFTNPDEIAAEFRAKIIDTFGEQPKVDEELLETAEYFTIKMRAGGSLAPVVDLHLERHPEDKEADIINVKDKLKHRINRFEADLKSKKGGDKK